MKKNKLLEDKSQVSGYVGSQDVTLSGQHLHALFVILEKSNILKSHRYKAQGTDLLHDIIGDTLSDSTSLNTSVFRLRKALCITVYLK